MAKVMPEDRLPLGFIGAGNMAEAIARRVLAAGVFTTSALLAADPSPARRALFSEQLQIEASEDSAVVAHQARTILLAVKPQKIDDALAQIRSALSPDTLLISIVAAVSTTHIEAQLAGQARVIRVMPNTPALVGAAASVLCRGAHALATDMAFARRIFDACGKTWEMPESSMNVVTSLSGSGPAYVFFLAEALAQAATELGLPPADAQELARQTIVGAGRLLAESTESAAELRRKVTSPGGTTEAAIQTLENRGFPALIVAALAAAAQRARELGR